MIHKIIFVMVGGAFGALSRWVLASTVQTWVNRQFDSGFPWGTASANILGCFLFGIIWAATEDSMPLSAEARLLLLTGFMGSFTTFSTFMFDTNTLLSASGAFQAALNAGGQVAVGLLMIIGGLAVGRLL